MRLNRTDKAQKVSVGALAFLRSGRSKPPATAYQNTWYAVADRLVAISQSDEITVETRQEGNIDEA
jgi:hypothetical protein